MHEIKGEKKTNQKMEITEVKVEKFGAAQLEKRGENGRLESGDTYSYLVFTKHASAQQQQ